MSIETGARVDAEFSGMVNQVGNLRAPDLVLGWKAIDVGARAADPSPLQHHGGLPGLCQMPGEILSAFAASDDYILIAILLHRNLSLDSIADSLAIAKSGDQAFRDSSELAGVWPESAGAVAPIYWPCA